MPSLTCWWRTHIFRPTRLPIRPMLPHRQQPRPDCWTVHPRQARQWPPPNTQTAAPHLGNRWETDSVSFLVTLAVYSANAPSRSPPTQCGTHRNRSDLTSLSLLARPRPRPRPRSCVRQPTLRWLSRSTSRVTFLSLLVTHSAHIHTHIHTSYTTLPADVNKQAGVNHYINV
jgi:hypothetical protein